MAGFCFPKRDFASVQRAVNYIDWSFSRGRHLIGQDYTPILSVSESTNGGPDECHVEVSLPDGNRSPLGDSVALENATTYAEAFIAGWLAREAAK